MSTDVDPTTGKPYSLGHALAMLKHGEIEEVEIKCSYTGPFSRAAFRARDWASHYSMEDVSDNILIIRRKS